MATDATRIILVRHGETEHNARKLFQGQLDTELNHRGRSQAAALAERLRREDIERCYTSDLARAAETAAIAIGHDRARRDPELRERHYGAWQGLPMTEVAATDPEGLTRHRAADPAYAPPGGETWGAFCDRAWNALQRIAAAETGRHVLVVTHGGVLRAVAKRVLGLPLEAPRRFSITNAAINRLSYADEQWRLDTWGEAEHLVELGYIRL